MLRRLLLLLICCLRLWSVQGQSLHYLHAHHVDSLQPVPQHLFQPEAFPDSSMIGSRLQDIVSALHRQGYLAARVDSIRWGKEIHHAYIFSGAPFIWQITETNAEEAVWRALNLVPVTGNKYTFPEFQQIRQQLAGYYENHGFPFARIRMDQIAVEEPLIKGSLVVERMDYYSFDTLQLAGSLKVNPRFLANHTNIHPGAPYSQQLVSEISDRLSGLPFLNLAGEPVVVFTRQQALITVPVTSRRANRFDGMAGLSGSGSDNDPYRITGMLNLALVNALERGESLDIRWQGLGHGSQRLEARASYPYIFSLPVIPGVEFSLHKQDSTYITVAGKPWLAFRTSGDIQLSAFADFRTTNILGSSSDAEKVNTDAVLYGLEFLKQSPGFSNHFREGSRLKLSVAAGNRNIRNSPVADQESPPGQDPRQNQFAGSLEAALRLPVGTRISLVSQLEASGIFSKRLFENELYRLGGFQSLKGFDEESILASGFGVLTQELRYFTSNQSFISMLVNVAWYEKKVPGHYQRGWPMGGAAGISLETTPGILSLYYALGKWPGEPFTFRDARIHFGFISLF